MVYDYRPHKQEKHRVRLTVGRYRLPYNDDVYSPVAPLLEIKLLLNSTIPDASKGACFMTLDIKDFPLQTLIERPEYIRIHSKYFSQDMNNKYHILIMIFILSSRFCSSRYGLTMVY